MAIQTRMTAKEFLELPETNNFVELLDGEVIMSPTPFPKHQDVVGNTFIILKGLTSTIGGKVYLAPLSVYLDDNNIPEPDVIWIAPNGRCVVGEKWLTGPPDLVVEVLSPSTGHQDKVKKFKLYERQGIREYWIADPVHRLLEVWVLIDGKFVEQGIFAPEDTFQSPVLGGQTIDVSAIFN
jgi:Uma2 family endonuclease